MIKWDITCNKFIDIYYKEAAYFKSRDGLLKPFSYCEAYSICILIPVQVSLKARLLSIPYVPLIPYQENCLRRSISTLLECFEMFA